MLYSEFLKGTGAVDNQETYNEYKRVEQIYMEADSMTKEDAYRMAVVVTEKEAKKIQKKAQKQEIEWVLDNILAASAFIRGMSEKRSYCGSDYTFISECGNRFELRKERDINCGSVILYEMFINGEKADLGDFYYKLLPRSEFPTYRANWHNKTKAELEEMFGYIA